MASIVWLREDLRLADNPALAEAAKTGPVVPVYILDEESDIRPLGGASRWWLHHSLAALGSDLAKHGAKLVLRRGHPAEILPALIRETKAERVFWNRRYEPKAATLDAEIEDALDIETRHFDAALLHEPWTIRTQSGGPFQVFTAFWRHCLSRDPPAPPVAAPRQLTTRRTRSDDLANWGLLPSAPDWAGGLRETWIPGEAAARRRLSAFLKKRLAAYDKDRDLPAEPGTSMLSPHLRWGEIGPRQVWHAAARHKGAAADTFLKEIGWREFSYHLLHHFPDLPSAPLRERFGAFPWRNDKAALRAWQRGSTGYPIVDAGMRQLWRTGWMHNRVRMIVASFLVKHLLLPWQEGEAWFWDTLVDADAANNAANWQWVAGSGADAAPYFRIFNPTLQSRKFDPDGTYLRRWVPEIKTLPKKDIHAPEGVARYPAPIVEHKAARRRALAAFEKTR